MHDEFEIKLREAFLRRPAPPGLRQRILDARDRRRLEQHRSRVLLWQRLAACLVVAVALGSFFTWRHVEEERRGEAARREVLTALRITNHALEQIHARLAARDRAGHE
ncbi:MAG TPA: hypothetical protein VL967_15855 [Terracidiphilus sp.]|nr:hypothetical protein [Terracidiphilus sp.]